MFQGSSFGGSPSTPFGQSTFGKPATTGFNAPVFGSTGGTSLFGSTTTQPSGGLFGSTAPTPAFGQPQTTQPAFGGGFSTGSTGTGLFGAQQNANTGSLFGTGTTSAFGQAKPTFGGFGATQQSTGLFGQQPQPQPQQQTSLFGQPSGQSPAGLFGSGPFGSTAAQGGTTVKFTPVTGSDTMVKNGVSTTISTRHHCITCMKEYESKSLEELRLEDYTANRKGPQQGTQATGGLFGAPGQTSLFGSTNTGTTSGFGTGTSNVFGTGTTASNVFGKPAGTGTPAFGAPATTAANSGFGFNTNTALFGSNTNQVKPFSSPAQGTGLFGSTSQPSSGFGTQTSGFGVFGAQQQSNMFTQNKPTFNLSTTSTPAFAFGQTSTTSAPGTSLFGVKPATTGFGTTTGFGVPATTSSAFGTGAFGTTNQTTPLFGSNFQANTTNFGFGQTSTTNTLGTGGMALGGGSSFFSNPASKPGSLFGQTSSTGLFGTNTFGTNASPFNTSAAGRPQTSTFSLGGTNVPGLMQGGGLGAPAAAPTNNALNQHMLALASMPFGDSPLFKNLLPATGKADELIKPTSPAAQKALITGQNYKISPKSGTKIKVKPIGAHSITKKSLFDGLESEDDSHEYLSGTVIKPSPRRLVLKPRPYNENTNRHVTFLEQSASDYTGDTSQPCSPVANSTTAVENQSPPSRSSPQNENEKPCSSGSGKDKSQPSKKSLEVDTPDDTILELRPRSQSPTVICVQDSSLLNKETGDQSTSSSSGDSELEDTVAAEIDGECEDHPTGIVLRRVGYYTIPPLDELTSLIDSDGRCIVDNFTIGRLNYGNIFYPDSFDVTGLNIDEIVHFRHKEVVVYPDDEKKPEVGDGLNRRAQVTLDRVWPIDKTTREPISDPMRIGALDYESKLRIASAKHGTRFVEYRPQTGSWVFKVDHFSKYGLSDSDEEETPVQDIKKLKMLNMQNMQGVLPLKAPPMPPAYQTKMGNGLAGLHPSSHLLLGEEDEEMEDGISTPFDLVDDEIDRGNTMSPTSKLAQQLGTSSHKLQLMKASFFHTDDYNGFQEGGEYTEYEAMNCVDGYLDEMRDDLYRAPNVQTLSNLFRGSELPRMTNQLRRATVLGVEEEDSGDEKGGEEDEENEEDGEEPMESVEGVVGGGMDVRGGMSMGEVLRPVLLPLKYSGQVLSWNDTSSGKMGARCLADLSLSRGVGMKVGWGPDAHLSLLITSSVSASLSARIQLTELNSLLSGRHRSDTSQPLIHTVQIRTGDAEESHLSFQDIIEPQLEVALRESVFSQGEDGIPCIVPRPGVSGVHKHATVAENMASGTRDQVLVLWHHVWSLCLALWGNLPYSDVPEGHSCVMERRQEVSEWLEMVVADSVNRDASISGTSNSGIVFSLMTGACIAQASSKAQENGDHQLSLLLSQSGSGMPIRNLIKKQLGEWRETLADRHIDRDRLKILMLVAGLALHEASDSTVNTCLGLDWIRAFALHLWYVCPLSGSVTDALLLYEKAFEGEDSYAVPPLPGYCSAYTIETSSGSPIYDVTYNLLKLFSQKSHPLEQLLNPATYSPDPFDYRLSWFLMRVLISLGYSHMSDHCKSIINSSFASQLEAHDLWHWAVFVLLHVSDPGRRCNAILDVLSRHITLDEDCEKEKFLREHLNIPEMWIYDAKATRALSEKKYHEAAQYLIQSCNWNLGHSIIMEHIYSKAIVNERYDYLEGLLKEFEKDDRQKHVFGWQNGGAVILEYLYIVKEVQEIIASQDPKVSYHLERLKPQITDLCSRIKLLPTPTPLHRLCQAEMAKRCSGLVQNLVMVEGPPGDPQVGLLSDLVAQLPLPSDYAQQEWHGVVSSWPNIIDP